MNTSDYFHVINQALTNMETATQLLRTAVTTLYENAMFDPNKKFPLQSTDVKFIESIRTMALGNVALKLFENRPKRSDSFGNSLVFQG